MIKKKSSGLKFIVSTVDNGYIVKVLKEPTATSSFKMLYSLPTCVFSTLKEALDYIESAYDN